MRFEIYYVAIRSSSMFLETSIAFLVFLLLLISKKRVSMVIFRKFSDFFTTTAPTYMCEICVETKPLNNSFDINGCSHFYCIECIVKYIESKLGDNVTRIVCPVTNCEGVLDPHFCREILPMDLFNRWGEALCESAFLESEKFYCPYNDCSVLLINDVKKKGIRKNIECPTCRRAFCVQCKVAWHKDLDCIKFQKQKRRDGRFLDLATRNKWKQCPNCKIYVEKIDGCNIVKCKCGKGFCYNCGAESKVLHFCSNCNWFLRLFT